MEQICVGKDRLEDPKHDRNWEDRPDIHVHIERPCLATEWRRTFKKCPCESGLKKNMESLDGDTNFKVQ